MRRIVVICAIVLTGSLVEPTPAAASSSSDPPDLSGRWAMKVVQSSISEVPVVGEVSSQTVTYLTVEIEQEGRALVVETETCDVSIQSDSSLVQTVLPKRFAEAVPDARRRARLVESGEGTRLIIERNYSVIGASLREPTSETLPTSPDDPRVRDSDGDGHPGVTVRTRGVVAGEIYVVQRAWDRYVAPVRTAHRIVGRVSWKTEQRVLDATSIFLRSAPSTRPDPDGSRNYFEMVRVPADADCDEITTAPDALFER